MIFINAFQIPRKQPVEKPARAIERRVIEMEKKNLTYTLLDDSESDGEPPPEKEQGKKSKTKGNKRKHIRQKQEERDSSSEEDIQKR